MEYQIELIPLALNLLSKITDKRIQQEIQKRIEKLKIEPDKQGKVLSGKLKGYRSVRAVGQRYRIIYRVEESQIVVIVIAVGIRKQGDKKDIYTLLEKLINNE
jgi:mRNA interferase RelE/StbE